MTGLVDTHCHLAHLEEPVTQALARARAQGVSTVVDVGMGLAESRAAAARAGTGEGVHAVVGVHPNELAEFEADPDATMVALAEIARGPGVVGIGETGIDHYRDGWPHDIQERAFREHIELAKTLDLTLVIHCRDAHDSVLEVLDDAGAPGRVVMHCFSGDVTFARRCNEHGYFCSFAGNITYKRNDELREAARAVRGDLLLVETDAPFLAPMPDRGKPNSPALLVHTVRALAEARSEAVDALSGALTSNAHRAFVIA